MGVKVLSPVFTHSIHQKEIAEGVCMRMQNYMCGFWWLIMVASMIKTNLTL